MADAITDLIRPGEPTLLVSGGDSEGPVWHPDGYVMFVRFKRSELVRWHPVEGASVIRTETGHGNGTALDLEGRLVMCESGTRRVTRLEDDGSLSLLTDCWNGRRLNRPNDVICRSDGTLYFTDPQMRVPVEERELGFAGVFRIDPHGATHLATDECEYPNGLALSPDESTLYVVISRLDDRCLEEIDGGQACPHRLIRAFDVAADGSLSANRVFCDMTSSGAGAPDGMTVDSDGRVYCTNSDGIWVIDEGVHLGTIGLPERPRNLTFGGPELSTLFVTAGTSLYAVETRVHGVA